MNQLQVTLDRKILSIPLKMDYTIKTVICDYRGEYQLILLSNSEKNLYIVSKTREVGALFKPHLPALIKSLGFDETKVKYLV